MGTSLEDCVHQTQRQNRVRLTGMAQPTCCAGGDMVVMTHRHKAQSWSRGTYCPQPGRQGRPLPTPTSTAWLRSFYLAPSQDWSWKHHIFTEKRQVRKHHPCRGSLAFPRVPAGKMRVSASLNVVEILCFKCSSFPLPLLVQALPASGELIVLSLI